MMTNSKYEYNFSIIMSIYNVEEYLEEAIESIVNQTIGFEENVQLILVNDGSPDNSEEICLKYKEKFPNNVVYVKKENGGLSSAKNCGLKYRRGKYINFFDPDDILEPNTLEEVYKFFQKNYNTIPMVAIPLYFFEARSGIHGKYKYMGNKNRIINLDAEPYNFVLSSASSFYKTELFDKFLFDERMIGAEDTKLNFQIFDQEPYLGYVCQKEVRYHYRKRFAGNSIVDNVGVDTKSLYSITYLFDCLLENKEKGHIKDYLKELIIYETNSRVKNLNEENFKEDYEYIIEKYRDYLSYVDKEYIVKNKTQITTRELQYLYLSNFMQEENAFTVDDTGFVKYKDISLFPLSHLTVALEDIRFNKDDICFKITFWDYGIKNIELIAKDNKGRKYNLTKGVKAHKTHIDRKFGLQEISKTKLCTLNIPYEHQKFSFYVRNKNNKCLYRINAISTNPLCKLSLKDREIRLIHKDFVVKYNVDQIAIKNYTYPSRKYNWFTYKRIRDKYNYNAFMRLFNRRKKEYILINDRPEKGADNGEAIFKYINANEKKIAKKTYFVISKKCKDYKRLKKFGKVVDKDSLKHKFLFLNSKAIMASHAGMLFCSPFNPSELKYYRDLLKFKFVWLQHGITQNDISRSVSKYRGGIDYVVTVSKKEFKEFTKAKYFYEKDDVILCGFPRYDYLKDDSKNIITIAPTWRAYLSGKISTDGYHEIKEGFEQSEYFAKYSEILTDKKLYDLLKKNGYKLRFLLHPGMAGYTQVFKNFANDCVEVVEPKDINYSKVFAESKLLITDYSSVFFDFAYLKKPVIYYQFDKDEFFGKHYKKGYFDYEDDGLGKVTYDYENLFEKIEYYFNNGFKMEEEYLERVANTFKHTDSNNCRRLIKALKKKKVL